MNEKILDVQKIVNELQKKVKICCDFENQKVCISYCFRKIHKKGYIILRKTHINYNDFLIVLKICVPDHDFSNLNYTHLDLINQKVIEKFLI